MLIQDMTLVLRMFCLCFHTCGSADVSFVCFETLQKGAFVTFFAVKV